MIISSKMLGRKNTNFHLKFNSFKNLRLTYVKILRGHIEPITNYVNIPYKSRPL